MHHKSILVFFLIIGNSYSSTLGHNSPEWKVAPGTNFTVAKVRPQQFRLANIYGSDMVLQMAPKRAHIWGFGQPFAEIVLRFDDAVYSATVSRSGEWSIRLPPQPAGGPHTIIVEHVPMSLTASQSIELERVMFGDVWICSGGSNMAQELHSISGWQEEVKRAKSRPLLRLFQSSRSAASTPQNEGGVVREWETTNEDVILSYFPALCLLYGIEMTEIHPERPIGMIEAAWGGTPIQAWSSDRVFRACRQRPQPHTPHHPTQPQHAELIQGSDITVTFHSHAGEHSRIGQSGSHPIGSHAEPLHAIDESVSIKEHTHIDTVDPHSSDQYTDSALWNGMIFPLTKLAIRGVIWHQGEANTAYQRAMYHCFFFNMIMDWQKAFVDWDVPVAKEQNMHLPFGYVQLGPSRSERHSDWWSIRLQQSIADSLFNLPGHFLPETFMAPAYDLIDAPDVKVTGLGAHYHDKARVADRLALAARQLMYDSKLVATGPVMIEMVLDYDQGYLNITYDKDIQVRGPDGFFIESYLGKTNTTEIVDYWDRGVAILMPPDARRVSYGWGALPCEHLRCAIYSVDPHGHGLPAVIFNAEVPRRILQL